MFIKKVKIENFRGFEENTIEKIAIPNGKDNGSGLNILIGENNSGKTSFIKIFTKLKDNEKMYDEEKNKGNDIKITITDSEDKDKIIENIGNSSNIDITGDSEIGFKNFDILKDNRVWNSKASGDWSFESYRLNANFERSSIDSHLSDTLSNIEKNDEKKKNLMKFLKK